MWLSRCFDWRGALTVVTPRTFVAWYRQGFQFYWRRKCQAGRPPIPPELQHLIGRMARENPLWGEERIANEPLLKLGLRVSPRTVRKYLPKLPAAPVGKPRGDQHWSTFLKNHAQAIVARDFCVVATATFQILYVFVVMEHASRRMIHVNATAHPTAAWTLQQLREAYHRTIPTGLSSTTTTPSSPPDSMSRSRTSALRSSQHPCGARKRTRCAKDSSGPSGGSASIG
jgi:putative transposase